MAEYLVFFATKLTAKSDKQLEKRAEIVQDSLTKHLKKQVYAHGYVEIEKQDRLKVQTND